MKILVNENTYILTRWGRLRKEREQASHQMKWPSSEHIRETATYRVHCASVHLDCMLELLEQFLSLSFFSVSTRGFATIPWSKVKGVGTIYDMGG